MMLGTFSLYLDVPYYHINIVITLITFVFIEVNLLYLSRIFSRQGLTDYIIRSSHRCAPYMKHE
jgi:hypothetical protein